MIRSFVDICTFLYKNFEVPPVYIIHGNAILHGMSCDRLLSVAQIALIVSKYVLSGEKYTKNGF